MSEGDNFGLNDNFEYYELELDSLDNSGAKSGSAAATDWPLFYVAAKGPLDGVVAMKVIEVQIPNSWYVFNSVNRSFLLTETGHAAVTISLPIGNYTADEVATNLAAVLSSTSPSLATYDVEYNVPLNKFIIQNNSVVNAPFTFTFGAGYGIPGVDPNSGNTNPRLWIGFPPGDTTSQVFASGSGGNIMTAPNCQLVSGPNYLYLNSTEIGPAFDVFLPQGAKNLGGGLAGPQIAKISITDNSGGIIYWSDPDPQKWFKFDNLRSINSLDMYLTLGNTTSQIPLQLNGLSFSLKIGVLKRKILKTDQGNSTMGNGRVATRQGPKRIRLAY